MLVVVAVLLAVFVLSPPWGVVAVALAALVEVVETVFWIRLSRRSRVRAGAEALIGAQATAVTACRPSGRVRLAGELWSARCPAGADAGARVVVTGLEGLTLVVRPDDTSA